MNEETEEAAKKTKELRVWYNINYSENVNQIKQLAIFTFQKSDVNGFNLLEISEIHFVKNYM